MRDTSLFEKFLNTAYGRRIWRAFLQTKKGTENPVEMILSKFRLEHNSGYLEIGGGFGEKTLKIAKKYGFKNIDFIEPSKKASDIFTKKAKSHRFGFRIFNTPFEKFQPDTKYDLITSIHSWYYIDLKEIDKLYNILNKNGVACIFLDRKSDTIKKIQDVCEKFLGFQSNNIEDIVEYFEKRKIKYNLFCENKKLKGLIKNNKLTERARTIISLVSYTPWDKILNITKEEIRLMLIKLSKNDTYPINRCLIVIRKP